MSPCDVLYAPMPARRQHLAFEDAALFRPKALAGLEAELLPVLVRSVIEGDRRQRIGLELGGTRDSRPGPGLLSASGESHGTDHGPGEGVMHTKGRRFFHGAGDVRPRRASTGDGSLGKFSSAVISRCPYLSVGRDRVHFPRSAVKAPLCDIGATASSFRL